NVAARTDENFQMEFEIAPEDIRTQEALRSCVFDSLVQDVFLVLVLMAYVEDARPRPRHQTRDDHTFHHQVRQILDNKAVLDGSRLALIRIADDVLHRSGRL